MKILLIALLALSSTSALATAKYDCDFTYSEGTNLETPTLKEKVSFVISEGETVNKRMKGIGKYVKVKFDMSPSTIAQVWLNTDKSGSVSEAGLAGVVSYETNILQLYVIMKDAEMNLYCYQR